MAKKKVTMLTTYDNKFDPFDEWEKWYDFDTDLQHPHNTCAYLARMTDASPEMSQADQELATLIAMQKIIEFEPETYKLITKEVEEDE